jgi:hypothetical protein
MNELDRFLNRARPPLSPQPKLRRSPLRQKRELVFTAIALGILAAGVLYFLWRVVDSGVDSDARSCLASATDAVQRQGSDQLKRIAVPTREWQTLSDSVTDQLFELAHLSNCDGGSSKPPFLDRWGQRIRIMVRELDNGVLEFRLASNGADGRPDTKDDIVYPFSDPGS